MKKSENELHDRRKVAADAKKALLENFRAAQSASAPERAAKQAERLAIATARDERRAERDRIKAEEQERLLREEAERLAQLEAEARAETEQREAADKLRISRVIEDEAARKAERDRRYAARKARSA